MTPTQILSFFLGWLFKLKCFIHSHNPAFFFLVIWNLFAIDSSSLLVLVLIHLKLSLFCYIGLPQGLETPGFLLDFLLPNKVIRRKIFSSLQAYFLCEAKFTEPTQPVTCPSGFLFLLSDLLCKPYGFVLCGLVGSVSVLFEVFCNWRLFFKENSSCSRFWILKLVDSYSFLENSHRCTAMSFCSKKLNVLLPGSAPSIYGLSARYWLLVFGHLELGRLPENSPLCAYLNESEHSLNAWCVFSCCTKRAWTIKRNGIISFWTASMHAHCDSFWQLRYLQTAPFSSWDMSRCVWRSKEDTNISV